MTDSRELGDVLGVALRAGQLMMENGANAARVEKAVARFAIALGAERVDVQANPSGIIATAAAGEEHRTRIRRVDRTGIDLNRMARIRAWPRSRWCCTSSRAITPPAPRASSSR